MMRAPQGWGAAVRRPDGTILARSEELPRLTARSRAARIPFVRGVMVLAESLSLGFRALSWSAQMSGDGEEEVTRGQTIATMVVGIVFALALFILVPVLAAHYLKEYVNDSSLAFVVLDGVIRLVLIVAYMLLISRAKEIQRVFMYHGAEHKTIHAYEAGDPLSIEVIQGYSPRHPRCGTSFIIIVGMVAFLVFLTLAPLPLLPQIVARIVLIPVIAGLSYEVLKAAAMKPWMAWASRPGIWLQRVTTAEPEDAMVPVAVSSLLAALSDDELSEVRARGPVADEALAAALEARGVVDG
jgi:uncharacterized protein YqhQ